MGLCCSYSSFPILPNPLPNTSVPGYGVIDEDYIQLFDRDTNTWEFLYLNPANGAAGVTRDGISYDPSTNTLTLSNYHGGGISANLLGNSFTVELIGENELTQDFMIWGFYTGGSIRFTGNGSLTINSSEGEVGLELICEFSTSCLMIEEGVTLDIYGSTASVEVIYTNAEKGIWYISDEPLEGIRQIIADESITDNPDMDSETLYQVWVLTDDGGETFLPHLHIEGQ